MKKLIIFVAVLLILASFMMKRQFISSIYGTIEPAEAAKMVWAINGKDSLSVVPESGKFSIAVTAGTWRLHVFAIKPYKDMLIDSIKVIEGKSSDAGVIRMNRE